MCPKFICFELPCEIQHVTFSKRSRGKRWTSASVYSKAEDVFMRECLRRLSKDLKVRNGQRASEWEYISTEPGWSGGGRGSVSSGLAQASLVCLMCHYERLAPGAGLQLSHSIISEADSQTHTAHTHTA